ncbi:hypothetical protein CEUSTIGMA_g4628.t1 [Chlamydomonas eustigma]|uniref:ELM2 domain-containing protein n=1 Tax=Chlamydomonas eustigma TaxID=1157962 RepID=A0A250X2R2_9CHLO|nr:hypothetical protein CEUSTIGMA_g4628.t1 [Chlamydomonas eustigma]|eukprot:GAX77182.1 hypothetical protein CEUSTIGMA_g4628.t1 [Chlamydomonas eustigma]
MPLKGKNDIARKSKNAARKQKSKPLLTAQQLYEKAQAALLYDDYDTAREALRQAASLEPENLEIVEAYGSLLAELGEQEQAVLVLQKVVSLSPELGHEKYLYLGQLVEGDEGLAYTRKGVELLQQKLNEAISSCSTRSEDTKLLTQETNEPDAEPSSMSVKRELLKVDGGDNEEMEVMEEVQDGDEEDEVEEEEEVDDVEDLREGLCSALCSLAEMLMGRSESLECGSECEEVEGLLDRARTACCSSPEPDQVLASLRYEQGRPEEALEALRKSMKLWFCKQEEEDEDMEAVGDEIAEGRRGRKSLCGEMDSRREEESSDKVPLAEPSYEFRFECAKLLLELDDTTDVAIQVLEDLVEEDDCNPHTWHLLGTAYYAGGMLEDAQEIHDKGLALLKKLKVPQDDDVYHDFADLKGAIEDASCKIGS